ncbi:o-succinylbenzoate synthase [Psychromonas hadalis]|uniref:o-succinylbenzoate synthase n=1 Tax=Psychromonas hadalis TaxID=211669 RepID=UPI0003B4F727|nr:o-succinylbenzoate synthase [Psychromonas hadalis]
MCHKITDLPLVQAKLFIYQQSFKIAMQFKTVKLSCREGLILQLIDKAGESYFAEIAPLPGFSKETLTNVTVEMRKLLASDHLTKHQLMKYRSPYQSIQFALDSLFTTTSKSSKQQVNIDNVPLLQADNDLISQQYQSLNKPNLIKLKVARDSLEADILNFQQLCQLNPNIKIRCDANQNWTKQQAAQFFSAINVKQLDYIEEPTSSHHSNLQLAEQYQFQLGLDETLQQANFNYLHHHSIKALIIKPSLIGSREKTDKLVSFAQKHRLQVSFSSSFESALGLQQIKNLAAHYHSQYKNQLTISLGIDTLKYFTGTHLMNMKQLQQDCLQLECLCSLNY